MASHSPFVPGGGPMKDDQHASVGGCTAAWFGIGDGLVEQGVQTDAQWSYLEQGTQTDDGDEGEGIGIGILATFGIRESCEDSVQTDVCFSGVLVVEDRSLQDKLGAAAVEILEKNFGAAAGGILEENLYKNGKQVVEAKSCVAGE